MENTNKRRQLFCPACGSKLLKTAECRDTMIECIKCGATLFATVAANGDMAIDLKANESDSIYLKI
jgi:hypothetical protein